MAYSLKARLKPGEKALGAWTMSDSADNAEVLALSGVDFIMMDQEHGQGLLTDAIAQMRAMAATKCVPMIRGRAGARGKGIHGPQVNARRGAKAGVPALPLSATRHPRRRRRHARGRL